MADTFDPDERFTLDMDPEDALRRVLGADEDADPEDAEDEQP